MTKEALRRDATARRMAMPEGEYVQRCHTICELFFAGIDLSFVQTVHTYLPMPGRREADVWPIIDRIRREFPHVRLAVPRVRGEELENFLFEGLHQLKPSTLGIPEPTSGVPVAPEKIDAVITPLLLADRRGNRLGYGKGFYDRFLSYCRPDCLKIGISLLDPINELPADRHDIRLDRLITSSEVLAFG